MPVIAFSSPKGGAGKTTAATVLATVLAERDASVTVIDADPNKNVVDWSKLPGRPASLTVVGDVTEETIAWPTGCAIRRLTRPPRRQPCWGGSSR